MKIMINIRKKYSKEIDTKEEIMIKNQRLRVLFNKLDETMVEENELEEKLKSSEKRSDYMYYCFISYFVIIGIFIVINLIWPFYKLKYNDISLIVNVTSFVVPIFVVIAEIKTNIQSSNYTAIQQVKNNRNNLQNQIYNMAFNLYINDDLSTENRLNFEQNILNNSEFKKNKE